MRLVGLGGGTGGCLAWGGTGGGASESAGEGAAWEGRGGSSTIRETVLGGLATATAADEELEEEEEAEDEGGVGLLLGSAEGVVRNFGGSRACLGGGASCCESCSGRGSGAKRTPADSERSLSSAAGMYLGRVVLLSASDTGRTLLLSSEELFCRGGRRSISEEGLTMGRGSSTER